MSQIEAQSQGKHRFIRADSLADPEQGAVGVALPEDLLNRLRKVSKLNDLEGQIKAQGTEAPLLSLVEDEAARRFADMQEIYAKLVDEEERATMEEMASQLKPRHTVLVNTDNPLYSSLADRSAEDQEDLLQYAYYLALLAKDELRGDELKAFLKASEDLWAK